MRISYPVLRICPKFIQGQLNTKKDLFVVSEKKILQGCLLNCKIITSEGLVYQIINVSKEKRCWSLYDILFYEEETIWINYEFKFIKELSLNDFKLECKKLLLEKTYKVIKDDKVYLEKIIEKSSNFKSIIQSITIYP